ARIGVAEHIPIGCCASAWMASECYQVETPRLVATLAAHHAVAANISSANPQHAHDRDVGLWGKSIHNHPQNGPDGSLLRHGLGYRLERFEIHVRLSPAESKRGRFCHRILWPTIFLGA